MPLSLFLLRRAVEQQCEAAATACSAAKAACAASVSEYHHLTATIRGKIADVAALEEALLDVGGCIDALQADLRRRQM
jgi:hypothetical protein